MAPLPRRSAAAADAAGMEAIDVPGAPVAEPQWVADDRTLAMLCREAATAGRVAVDTEADSFHSYFHKLCLVQLSFAHRHALLDPLVLGREGMTPFAELCASADVVKVLHGADYDLRILHRDLGVRMRNVRDTHLAAQLLGEAQTGLAAMLEKEFGLHVGKEHQRADFGQRPLPAELRRYAAADTAHLCALADILEGRLGALGRVGWWLEECRVLETVEWRDNGSADSPMERIPGAARLEGEARDRLAALAAWRESTAAAADVPPFRILRNETLVQLAVEPPADLAALAARRGVGRGVARRFGKAILAAVTDPPPAPPRPPRQRRTVDRERERRIAAVRALRDEAAAELGISGGLLAPRAALEELVDRGVADRDGIRACLGRDWRTTVLAPRLLPLLASWRGAGDGKHGAAV